MPFVLLWLLFIAVVAVPRLGAEESAEKADSEKPVVPEVWVTSIASAPASGDAANRAHYAGTASGLLLRPADVVRWQGADFGSRTVVMSHPVAVWCVQSSDDGSHVASTDYRGNLQILDTATSMATMHEAAFERWTQTMRFVPGTDSIVAGNEAGKFFFWEEGKVAKSIDVDKNALTDIAFNAAKDRIAISDGAGNVHFYSWPGLEASGKVKVGEGPAWCVEFTLDGTSILVGSSDRKLYKCEAKDAATPTALIDGTDWITRVAVSTAGVIAAAEVGGKVYLLENDKAQPGEYKPAGMSPSGVWAVSWSGDRELLLGTRKNGVHSLGEAWALSEFVPPKPAEAPATEAPAAEATPVPAADAKPEEKPADGK